MDIRDRRLKARLSKWSTCSVETKRGLVKPRKVIMLKRFLSYYKPQMGFLLLILFVLWCLPPLTWRSPLFCAI